VSLLCIAPTCREKQICKFFSVLCVRFYSVEVVFVPWTRLPICHVRLLEGKNLTTTSISSGDPRHDVVESARFDVKEVRIRFI
jgi:hypothetical protein